MAIHIGSQSDPKTTGNLPGISGPGRAHTILCSHGESFLKINSFLFTVAHHLNLFPAMAPKL